MEIGLLVFAAIAALIAWRTDIVYRANVKAIFKIAELVDGRMRHGDYGSSDDLWKIYEKQGFVTRMADMRKWTFKDFYPELAK